MIEFTHKKVVSHAARRTSFDPLLVPECKSEGEDVDTFDSFTMDNETSNIKYESSPEFPNSELDSIYGEPSSMPKGEPVGACGSSTSVEQKSTVHRRKNESDMQKNI